MYKPPGNVYADEEFLRITTPLLAEITRLHPYARYRPDHPQHARYMELAREYRKTYQRVWERLNRRKRASGDEP